MQYRFHYVCADQRSFFGTNTAGSPATKQKHDWTYQPKPLALTRNCSQGSWKCLSESPSAHLPICLFQLFFHSIFWSCCQMESTPNVRDQKTIIHCSSRADYIFVLRWIIFYRSVGQGSTHDVKAQSRCGGLLDLHQRTISSRSFLLTL